MKFIASLPLLLLFSISSYCQNKTPEKDHYLRKSKSQKTTGFILLGSGAALITTGAIIHGKSVKDNGAFLNFDGIGFETAGLLSMLSSIPFFIWSSKNKQKTISIAIVNQKSAVIKTNVIAFESTPALGVKVRL